MKLVVKTINCQDPPESNFIRHKHTIVQCGLLKASEEYKQFKKRANELASKVNPAAANASDTERDGDRLNQDSFGGVLAEAGWIQYINSEFGPIANSTPFKDANQQIDIILSHGELLEVRSSFPRNGVKFAICSATANFKNIGPYANQIKPGEIKKHFYLGVLFDTQKSELLSADRTVFSLVGGSTWKMMVEKGYNENLIPEGEYSRVRSIYKVIKFKDALDVLGVLNEIETLGYKRIQRP
ncbi:MAG: hypothetical protein TUN42_07480 [Dehalogenimonas sp.]